MVSRLATPATCSDILRIAVGLFQSSVVTLADWGAQARMSEVDLDENELIGAVQDEETAFYKVPTHPVLNSTIIARGTMDPDY